MKKIEIQGHRGCRGLMPENTINGFKKALDIGVDTLELDLSVNGEGDLIVSHEPYFNHEISTGPQQLEISEDIEKQHNTFCLTQAEIEQYDVGLKPHPRFPMQRKLPATKPTLTHMVSEIEMYARRHKYPSPNYNMEIKRHPLGDGVYHPEMSVFADTTISTIQNLGICDRTTVQCFDIETLQYLNKHYPSIKLVYLIENNNPIETNLEKLGFTPYIYSPIHTLVDADLVSFCNENCLKIIPWTVNTVSETKRLLALHIDGIISDYPDMIKDIVEKRQ